MEIEGQNCSINGYICGRKRASTIAIVQPCLPLILHKIYNSTVLACKGKFGTLPPKKSLILFMNETKRVYHEKMKFFKSTNSCHL